MHHANALLNVLNVLKYRRQCRVQCCVHVVDNASNAVGIDGMLTICWRCAGIY